MVAAIPVIVIIVSSTNFSMLSTKDDAVRLHVRPGEGMRLGNTRYGYAGWVMIGQYVTTGK